GRGCLVARATEGGEELGREPERFEGRHGIPVGVRETAGGRRTFAGNSAGPRTLSRKAPGIARARRFARRAAGLAGDGSGCYLALVDASQVVCSLAALTSLTGSRERCSTQ